MPLFERPRPYREHRREAPGALVDAAGTTLHYLDEGEGEPLLLLHGFASSADSFRDLIPLLAPGHRVIAPDLLGFGFSGRPAEADAYRPENQLRVIDALLERLGTAPCAVLGHSYGAALALRMAQRPRAPGRLVLLSPAVDFGRPPLLLRSRPGRALAYTAVRLLLSRPRAFRRVFARAYHQKEALDQATAERVRRSLLVEGMRAAFDGYCAAFRAGDGPAFEPSAVDTPTLVLAGRHDAIVPIDACQRVARSLRGARLQVLEASGHSAPEEQPAETAAAIAAFLGGAAG